MQTEKISYTIGTTDSTAPLGIEIWLDQTCVFDSNHLTETINLSHDVDSADASHELRFIMKNKLPEHTQINEAGEIIKDARLTISDMQFEEIPLEQLFLKYTVYTHDFNGTAPISTNQFYGELGCNGELSFKFKTPVYIWLLENMNT